MFCTRRCFLVICIFRWGGNWLNMKPHGAGWGSYENCGNIQVFVSLFLLLQNIQMMIVKTGRLSCILGTQSDWLVAGGRLDKWEHFASEMGYRIKFVPIQLALCHQVFHVIALCLMFGNATFSIRNRNYQMKFVYRFIYPSHGYTALVEHKICKKYQAILASWSSLGTYRCM